MICAKKRKERRNPNKPNWSVRQSLNGPKTRGFNPLFLTAVVIVILDASRLLQMARAKAACSFRLEWRKKWQNTKILNKRAMKRRISSKSALLKLHVLQKL